jgi:hypothetical protein
MKWQLPEQGNIRVRKKFAYLPVKIDNYIIWFEHYYSHQIYIFGRWYVQRKELNGQ